MADTRTRIINLPEATVLDASMNFVEDSADGSGTRRVTYDTLKGAINQEGAANIAQLKSDLLGVKGASKPYIKASDWEIGAYNDNGDKTNSDRIIRTPKYVCGEGTVFNFDGVIKGDSETLNRIIYAFCYDASNAFIQKTTYNRSLPNGTCYVAFHYGFTSSSGITVNSYGKDNLINDWSAEFVTSIDSSFTEIYDAIDEIEQATQAAVNNAYSESHLETQDYFPDEIDVSDLLKLEKVKCIHHDNFARADNASEIGDNGSDVMEVPLLMPYGTLSNVSAGTLNVGINSNRAVSSKSGNVPDANVTIKTVDPGQFPYKLLVACDADNAYGSVALGIESVGKYVLVNFTKNLVTIAPNATTQITDSASVTHSSGVPVYEIYVYKNRIAIYNIGVKLIDIPANMTRTLCGMRFRAGNSIESSQPYAFTEFCVFLPDQWKQDGFDRAWENYESITVTTAAGQTEQQATEQRNLRVAKSLGQFQTYTPYGITFETGNTVNSSRAVRFELHDTDPQHSNGVRAEIMPIRPQKDITLHTKILDFDVFFNASYDYDTNSDLIMQMHDVPDGINIGGLSPGIALVVYQDNLCITTQGSGTKVLTTEEKPTVKRTVLAPLPKKQWTHITIFLREGYETAHNPVVAVWVNGKLSTIDRNINAYNEPWGSYIKFGVYKGWKNGQTEVSERVLLFDNVHFWF